MVDYCLATCSHACYRTWPESSYYEHMVFDVAGDQWTICWDDQAVVMAIRGSDEPLDWVRNANLITRRVEHGDAAMYVHEGFWTSADLIWRSSDKVIYELIKTRQLYITGHSRGGAIAGILPIIWKCNPHRVTTFGAPSFLRPGSIYPYDKLRRYVNPLDPVPFVPKSYMHAGLERYVTRNGLSDNPPVMMTVRRWFNDLLGSYEMQRQHSMQNYCKLMRKAVKA